MQKKKSKKTKHWLRMISTTEIEKREEAKELWKEAQGLTLIFGKIALSLKNNKN